MGLDLTELYANRTRGMKTSSIREFFKLTERADVISFAGGFPSGKVFPVDALARITDGLLGNGAVKALQYGPTEGHGDLRRLLARRMSDQGCPATEEEILITSGSQQALDLLAKLFVDPGDKVLVEEPGYVGGLGAFRNYEADLIPIPIDAQGIITDRLRAKLVELRARGITPKLLYLVPNFQNPSGLTLSLPRRKEILSLAEEFHFLVVEDDPYGLLRYEGSVLASLKSMDEKGHVIYLGSVSKTLLPGIRVGWLHGPEELVSKMIMAKQATDLCGNSLGQRMVYEFYRRGLEPEHLKRLRRYYKRKRDAMLAALERYFPREVTWTRPKGGFFIWVTLPPYMDARNLLLLALQHRVAFVDGAGFHVGERGKNTLRLSFSEAEEQEIYTGIQRLGELIESEVSRAQ